MNTWRNLSIRQHHGLPTQAIGIVAPSLVPENGLYGQAANHTNCIIIEPLIVLDDNLRRVNVYDVIVMSAAFAHRNKMLTDYNSPMDIG